MKISKNQPKSPLSRIYKAVDKERTPLNCAKAGGDMAVFPTAEASPAVYRFGQFIRWTLHQGVTVLAPPQLLIASVLSLDGVTCVEDLHGCLHAISSAVRRGDAVYATWQIKDVTIRRSLSAITVLAAEKVSKDSVDGVDWKQQLNAFSETLRKFYSGAKDVRGPDRLKLALSDAAAWLYLHVPMACFAYATQQLNLSLLPELTHDRQCYRHSVRMSELKGTPENDCLAAAKDTALAKVFDASTSATRSQWIIGALKKVVSVSIADDAVRAADHLSKAAFRKRLDEVTFTMERVGTANDALLLAWVIYLLQTGSLRLTNPTMGTIARYVRAAVGPLHHALGRHNGAAVDLSQDDWEALFRSILAEDDRNRELRCALGTFCCYLVGEFGIEPIPGLFADVDEFRMAHANMVWPNEQQRVFDHIATSCHDGRMQQSMAVMVALAMDNKLRIGEVLTLRMHSIRLDGENLEVEIAPRKSHHEGKSKAARRILNYNDAPHRADIKSWWCRRRDESAEPGDLLFGDPHQPDKGYRLGACQRLINQSLRSATGDAGVSFHTLRHTSICLELRQALMTANIHRSISPIHQTIAEAGQRHESTAFISYFHMPEGPIRIWIDKAVAVHLDSPVVAAKWLDMSADALRQSRHRAADKAGLLPDQLRKRALSMVVAPVQTPSDKDAAVATPPCETVFMPMTDLMKLLQDINDSYAMAGIESRNGVSEKTIVHVCRAAAYVAWSLESGNRKSLAGLSSKANPEACLAFARARLQCSGYRFGLNAEPYLSGLVHRLQTATGPSEALMKASKAWIAAHSRDVVSLTDADAIEPLIALLHEAHVSVDHLVVRVQLRVPDDQEDEDKEDQDDEDDEKDIRKALSRIEVTFARAVIERNYSASAQIECVKRRRGCPNVYLVLSRQRTGTGKPGTSASCRMNRFNAWMFTLAVWHQYLMTNAKEAEHGDE